MIRSILEYATVIWNPFYKVYATKVERVQRKFTRMLYYKMNYLRVSYEDRLSRLEMRTLASRRVINDEMCLFKIVNGHIRADEQLDRIVFTTHRHFVRNTDTFVRHARRTNVLYKSPSFRLPDIHNTYFSDVDIRTGVTINTFRTCLYAYPLPFATSPFLAF